MTNENSLVPRIRFIGDGTTKNFNFFFQIFSSSDIKVYFKDDEQTSGFEVAFDKNITGGSVNFEEAPTAGTIITLVRNLAIKRTSLFSESQIFKTEMLNREFDYHIACFEQLGDHLNRTISFPINLPAEVDLCLPYPQGGKAIMWNAEGTKLTTSQVDIESLNSTVERVIEIGNDIESVMDTIIDAKNTAVESNDNVIRIIEVKAETDFSNVAENLDFVVESWLSDNKAWWYKVYKSGWIEQGGKGEYVGNFNLLIPFTNKNYFLIAGYKKNNIPSSYGQICTQNISEDVGYVSTATQVAAEYQWYACGY